MDVRWSHTVDSPPNGSPVIVLGKSGRLIGAVYLFANRWRAVSYWPYRELGSYAGKREAMRRVEEELIR